MIVKRGGFADHILNVSTNSLIDAFFANKP